MVEFNEIVNKFKLNFIRDGISPNEANKAFGKANPADLEYLTDLFGTFSKSSTFYKEDDLESLKKYNVPDIVVDFYRNFEPQNLPALRGGVRLMALESIKEENSSASPGMYFIKYGLLTIATTIGGHVICLDLNQINNNEPSVVIADYSFCSYNDDLNVIECINVPDEIADSYSDDEPIILSYSLMKSCIPQIATSFSEFLTKLANEEYEDIETEYLL